MENNDISSAFVELSKAMGEAVESLKALTDALPKPKVFVKNAPLSPKEYGLYLQSKRKRGKKR